MSIGQSVTDNENSRDRFHDRPKPDDVSNSTRVAYESAMKTKDAELSWHPIDPGKTGWLYSDSQEAESERGCIGHLRGDFGSSGKEFWTTWFTHQPGLLTAGFRNELQGVVDRLREKGGLLSSFDQMRKQCRAGTSIDESYGFHAESSNYEYCLRCIPVRGSYHLYLYCYDKSAQRDYAHRKEHQFSITERLKQKNSPGKPKKQRPPVPEH